MKMTAARKGRQVTREGRFRVRGDLVECVDIALTDGWLWVRLHGYLNIARAVECEPLDGLAVLIKQLAICAGEG